jgi:hypothetical protein
MLLKFEKRLDLEEGATELELSVQIVGLLSPCGQARS